MTVNELSNHFRDEIEQALADRIIVAEYDLRNVKNRQPDDPYSVIVSIYICKPDQWRDEQDYWLEELGDIPFFEVEPVKHKSGNRRLRYLLTECAMAHQSEMRVAA